MKKIILALAMVLLMVISVQASGIYSTVVDGVPCEIEFKVAPFSPSERGISTLYVDNEVYQTYEYYLVYGIYHVYGLCDFLVQGDALVAVKELGIIFYSK